MKMKKINLLIVFLLSIATLIAEDINETKLIKPTSNNPMDIPYEKWELSNGLKVLIHEDHSDPIVQVHITYHVGSNRETAGKSGFAHLFEHMMFQGSEHVEDEKGPRIIAEAGGQLNANINFDRTVYYQTVPSNHLETVLWLESDRMGFLLNAVDQEKFDNQREVVKNEKYQVQMQRPYGMSGEILGQTLYPPSHPYNWPIVGYMDDIERATLDDLKNFFLRWYGPNNAILTVSGDITSNEVIPLVEKYFGSINRGPDVRRQRANVPRVSSDIYTGYTDNIYLPMTDMVFPTVPNYHKDEAALDVLAALMGQSKKSIFYKNFVKSEKAIQASVNHRSRELSGEFHFTVLSFPDWQEDIGIYFNNIESDIRNTIADWEANGFSDEDLSMVKKEIETDIIDKKRSVSSKATAISTWEWLGRGKYNISSELDRYNSVTREDVMRVFKKYIKGKKAVINQVRPKSPFVDKLDSMISVNPNIDLILKEDPQYVGLKYNKPNDNFDRKVQPKAGPAKPSVIPDYYKENFENGLKLIGTKSSEIPKIYMRLRIKGGDMLVDKKISGLAELTADMMNESTVNYSSEEISVALQKLGSTVSFSADDDGTTMYIESLTSNIDATLAIAEEKLFRPKFEHDDFKRVKKQTIEVMEAMKKNTQSLGFAYFRNQIFGDTPFGRVTTEKSIKKIKLSDIKDYYNNYYSPTISSLVVVGDIDQSSLLSKINFLKSWKSKEVFIPSSFDFPETNETTIYLLDKEGASQSFIVMGHQADKYDVDGDYFKSQIMNYPLGGGMSGRFFLNLREDKGWTYGANSMFMGSDKMGAFAMFTSVKTEATDSALIEIFNEFNSYRTIGISEKELQFTKDAFLGREALKYETAGQKLGFLNRILTYDLDKGYIESQANILNSITKSDIDAIAKVKIKPEKMAIVIVGNKYLIKKKLKNLESSTDGLSYNFKIKEIKY
ncbi:MAG: peptidase M16 [Flavobacteriales bacterium]|nr:peptidase M16 [Flavobacteriales bacterium]|tara:strand:- start:13250 stop:16105 length:2856 start_codon:yes stop_codon:yes gene_type:complete